MPIKSVSSSPRLTRWAIGAGIALALFPFLMPTPAIAQVGTVNPLDDFKPIDNRDPFSSNSNSQSGMLDLIHRANLGTSRSLTDYNQDQQDNLNSAASDFRAKQLERLRTTSPTPVNPPAPLTPATETPKAN